MTHVNLPNKVKEMVVTATIHRANGTVEPARVVSYYHRNPLKRLLWRIFRRH